MSAQTRERCWHLVSDGASLGQDENIDERIEERDDETFFFCFNKFN